MDGSKIKLILFLILLSSSVFASSRPFVFYLKNEPSTLSPIKPASGESNYIHSTLFRGLTRFTDEGMLVFEDAKRCRYIIDTEIRCYLRKNLKYSDGSPLTAQNYVNAFRNILGARGSSYVVPMLLTIKNAKKVYLEGAPVETLGVKAINDGEIQFLLEEPDRDFLEKLSNPLFFPFKDEKTFNGPYKISKIEKGKKWILEPNLNYHSGNPTRPPIEILFVPNESTAVDLYSKKVIDFLWRLPTTEFDENTKSRKDLMRVDQSRYDFVGFNMRDGKPLKDKNLRKALAESVDFSDFKRLFDARGRAGCPGLGSHFLQENEKRCQNFSPPQEKPKIPHLVMNFSLLGGIDIERQAAWFQNQWKKNLDAKIEIKGYEQKFLISKLKSDPPDLFRKGISLNRPSCLAALEYFKSDHPENFTGFKSEKFDAMIKPLQTKKLSRIEQDTICAAANDLLFKEEYVGIPLGRIYFTMLVNPDFKGVKVNELNQLDLSELEYVGKK